MADDDFEIVFGGRCFASQDKGPAQKKPKIAQVSERKRSEKSLHDVVSTSLAEKPKRGQKAFAFARHFV